MGICMHSWKAGRRPGGGVASRVTPPHMAIGCKGLLTFTNMSHDLVQAPLPCHGSTPTNRELVVALAPALALALAGAWLPGQGSAAPSAGAARAPPCRSPPRFWYASPRRCPCGTLSVSEQNWARQCRTGPATLPQRPSRFGPRLGTASVVGSWYSTQCPDCPRSFTATHCHATHRPWSAATAAITAAASTRCLGL